jgi:hypothetical protein
MNPYFFLKVLILGMGFYFVGEEESGVVKRKY